VKTSASRLFSVDTTALPKIGSCVVIGVLLDGEVNLRGSDVRFGSKADMCGGTR
jgi:hypothetical protein